MSVPTKTPGVVFGLVLALSSCASEPVQSGTAPSLSHHWAGVWSLVGEAPDDELDGVPPCVATVSIVLDAEPSVEREVTGTVTWCGTPYGVKVAAIPQQLPADAPSYFGHSFCLMAVPVRMAQEEQHFGKWMFCVGETATGVQEMHVMFDPTPPYPGGVFGYTHSLTYVRSQS